jgi:serine protease Do
MKHLSRLVFHARTAPATSSIATLSAFTFLFATAALAPAAYAAQLLFVGPDSPALLIHSSQGYLGIEMRDIDNDRAAALKLKDVNGAEIVTVDHDAPAAKVGLRAHDVIQQMNGQTIQGAEQLRRMLRETPPGRSIALVISRDGQPQTINVQLADSATIAQNSWSNHMSVPDPDDSSDDQPIYLPPTSTGHSGGNGFFGVLSLGTPAIGVELDTLGSQLADYFGVKDGQGLLVKRVAENSPASTAGFRAGDIITKVNGASIPTVNTWVKTLHANRGKQVQVTIVRNHKEQTLSLLAGDNKHKGELVVPGFEFPGIDLESPQLDASLAQLDSQFESQFNSQLDAEKLAAQAREAATQSREAVEDALRSIDREKLAETAREAAGQIDAEKLAEQTREAVRDLDLPRLQEQMRQQMEQMKDQQQEIRKQMQDLKKSLESLRLNKMD